MHSNAKIHDTYKPMRPATYMKQRERAWDESFHMASSLDRVPVVHGTRGKAPRGYTGSSRSDLAYQQDIAPEFATNQGGIPVIIREETPSPVQSVSPTKTVTHPAIAHPLSRSSPDRPASQPEDDPFSRANHPLSRSSPAPSNAMISPRGALVPLAPSIQYKGRRAQTAPTRKDGSAASRMELKTLREQVGELSSELLQCRRQHQAFAIAQQNQKKKKKQQSHVIINLKKQLEDEQTVSADLRQQLQQQRKEMKKMQKTMETAATAMRRVQSQEEMIDSMRRQIDDLRQALATSEEENRNRAVAAAEQPRVEEAQEEEEEESEDELAPDSPTNSPEREAQMQQLMQQRLQQAMEEEESEEEDMLQQAQMHMHMQQGSGAGEQEDPENILGRAAMLGMPDLSLGTLIAAMEQMAEEKQSLEGTCQILVAQKEMAESRVMFMDMDADNDKLITREDLLGCQELTLPPFVVDRAFGGWVCRLTSKVRGKMNMTDFQKFRDWVDDACTSNKSLLCWFRCLDVDGDGVITFDDLKVVFREVMDFVHAAQQKQALEALAMEEGQLLGEDDDGMLGAAAAAATESENQTPAAEASDDAQTQRMAQQQIQLVKGDVEWATENGEEGEQSVGSAGAGEENEIEGEEEGEEEEGEEEEASADAADLSLYQAKAAEGPRLDVYLSRLSDMVQTKEIGRFTLSELKKAPLRGEFVQVALQPWWSKY